MSNITIGVDLAKRLFSVCEVDAAGHVLHRKDMGREAFALWLAQVPASTVVAMEACGGAHHWARRCLSHGLCPRLIAAQFVRPFRKSLAAKNDQNDAEAIATAARQGNMRFVTVKSVDQQARLAWHRAREGYKTEALALSNRIRGLLAEFGVVVPLGDRPLRTLLADLDAHPELPAEFKELLRDIAAHWAEVRAHLLTCDHRVVTHAKTDTRCQRIGALVGIGSLTADAVVATVGDGRDFKNGRQFAAWLGLTPRQHSSGGHTHLGQISRRGDLYLRMLLVQGARASYLQARRASADRCTPEQIWINQLACRLAFGKLLVAIANKHARQMWAMLAHAEAYDPDAWLKHPMTQRPAQRHAVTLSTAA